MPRPQHHLSCSERDFLDKLPCRIRIVVSHDLLTVRRRRRDTRCYYSVRFTCVLWWLSAWLSVNNTGVRFLQVYFVSAP